MVPDILCALVLLASIGGAFWMASVDWDRYRTVNAELESRACYNTSMTSAYDIDKLLARWDMVLQSKCLELKANGKPELLVLALEEQYKERKNHNTELKYSISQFSLPVVVQTLNDLVVEGVISDIVDSDVIEYNTIEIEWQGTTERDLWIFCRTDEIESCILELLRYEISLYYRDCATYGSIKLPLAPIIKFENIEIMGDNYPIDKNSFELRILKPVKRT